MKKKLVLKRETMRLLNSGEISLVHGGVSGEPGCDTQGGQMSQLQTNRCATMGCPQPASYPNCVTAPLCP